MDSIRYNEYELFEGEPRTICEDALGEFIYSRSGFWFRFGDEEGQIFQTLDELLSNARINKRALSDI